MFKFLALLFCVIFFGIIFISGASALELIDSFEDGDYTNNPHWTVDNGTWVVNDTNAKEGTYSLFADQSDSGRIYLDNNLIYVDGNLTVSAWFNFLTINGNLDGIISLRNNEGANNVGSIEWATWEEAVNFPFKIYNNTGLSCDANAYRRAGGAWYKFVLTHDTTNDILHFKVYDQNNDLFKECIGVSGTTDATDLWLYSDPNSNTGTYCDYVEATDYGVFGNVNIIFNVKRSDTLAHLTDVDVDCNVNSYDSSGNNSPFDVNFEEGVYSCDFSKSTFDTNTFIVEADANKTYTIYLSPETVAPTTSDNIGTGFYPSPQTITLTCNDGSGIGCDKTYYCQDSVNTCTPTTEGTSVIISGTTGQNTNKYVRYYSTDLYGNIETAKSTGLIILDMNAPTTKLTTTYYPTQKIAALNFRCYENGSGCKDLNLTVNGNSTLNNFDSNVFDYNLTTIGTHNIQYFSRDLNNNSETAKTTTAYVYGVIDINVFDEITNTRLSGASVNLYDTTFTTNATGNIIIDLNYLPTTTSSQTITVSKTSYGTRYFNIDLNATSNIGLNTLLLDSNAGLSIEFQYSSFLNKKIELFNWNKDWNKYAGITTTDSSGKFTFFINPQDQNYQFTFNDANDFNAMQLTLLAPKDEVTGLTIDGNYFIQVRDLGWQDYNNLSGNQVIKIYSGTTSTYKITFGDTGTEYADRTYQLSYSGGTTSASFQPYLIPSGSQITLTLITQDAITLASIENVLLKIFAVVPGIGRTLVESKTTDSSGRAVFNLIAGTTYDIEVWQNGVLKNTNVTTLTLTASDTRYIQIVQSISSWQKPTDNTVKITFTPNYTHLYTYDTSLTQTTESSTTISTMEVRITNLTQDDLTRNDVVIYDQNFIVGTTRYINTINLVDLDYNKGVLLVEVWVVWSEDNNTYYASTQYYPNKGGFDVLGGLQGIGSGGGTIRNMFGCSSAANLPEAWAKPCPVMIILALFVSLLVCFGLSMMIGFDKSAFIALFLIISGILTYLAWLPIVVYVFMFFIGVIIVLTTKGGDY